MIYLGIFEISLVSCFLTCSWDNSEFIYSAIPEYWEWKKWNLKIHNK